MSRIVYTINKGVDKPLEFRGLKAQYVIYLAAGLVGLLMLFALLYIAGLPSWACIGFAFTAGMLLFRVIYRSSRRYGQYGLMKKRAAANMPEFLRCTSGKVFMFDRKS